VELSADQKSQGSEGLEKSASTKTCHDKLDSGEELGQGVSRGGSRGRVSNEGKAVRVHQNHVTTPSASKKKK